MPTTSTAALYETLRTRALTYAPASGVLVGKSAGQLLGERYYHGVAPDAVAAYPYAVSNIYNRGNAGDGNREREQFEYEVMLYHRPRTKAREAEDLADRLDAAFLWYSDATSGLLFARSRTRQKVPDFTEETDREIVQIRLLYSFVVWPLVLTSVPA